MSALASPIRIGVFGSEDRVAVSKRHYSIWPAGYPGIVAAAGAEPVILTKPSGRRGWQESLRGLHGVIFAGNPVSSPATYADEQSLCLHCRDRKLPLLA